MADQINFFLDATDDVLLADGNPAWDGGQFSNLRSNMLKPNQSKLLTNCDIDRLGKLRTRRGTTIIAPINNVTHPVKTPCGVANKIVQGLTSYQTPDNNYIVAAQDRKIWRFDGGSEFDDTWSQIATGGVADNDEVMIYREGKIDNLVVGPPVVNGYPAGTTVLKVKEVGYVGAVPPPTAGGAVVAAGEKLYFQNNLRTDWYEYTIASVNVGSPTITITLEEPGLVFDVKDSWRFTVARPYAINHGGGYPKLHTGAITIDGNLVGEVNVNEYFVIKSENVKHKILTYPAGVPTTQITTYTIALEDDYLASTATVPVVFAQGQDMLFFCDGIGPIFGWNGKNLMSIRTVNTVDFLTGSTLHKAQTEPPQACNILLWFQNRLIASGIAAEPDAIYFSDFFDGTSWDRDYQKVRIGGGESDPITGLLAWTDYNLLVFKKNSIYVINLDPAQNPFPDDPTLLVASFAVKQLHKKIGCPAPMTAVQVGGGSTTPGSDVFFMDGDKKVHSIRRVLAAETQQEVGTAISLPIQDVLDQTSRADISLACATYHNEHYILGIPNTRGLQPLSGPAYPNTVVAYNLLTQSWCGVWTGWLPTCFAMRTDLGSYSKLIFGQSNLFPAGDDAEFSNGCVMQWMDDLSLDDETDTTYEDYVVSVGGQPITTQILTRAFTFNDFYSFKTGLNVELEFDESMAEAVTVRVFLDKIESDKGPLTPAPFTTLTELRVRLPRPGAPPLILPFTLPSTPDLKRLAYDLQHYGTWRELQFLIDTTEAGGKLAIRSIRISGFMDSLRLQTLPVGGIPELEVPPAPAGAP